MSELRIMGWNIQDLSLLTKLVPIPGDSDCARLRYIVDSIIERDPAIFVVVEVETAMPHSACGRGYVVAPTSGGPAVLVIYLFLRALKPRDDWRVVPPLLSGTGRRKEGIAVFFNNAKVNFRGPNQLDTTTIGKKRYQWSCGIGGPASRYLDPWEDALPDTYPVGPPIGNPPLRQNQLAGKTYFQDPDKMQSVPLDFPTQDCRSPFLTEFMEVGVPNPRTIKVLGVHLPPKSKLARKAVQNIARIPEMSEPLAPDEVRVVLGDFNIDFLRPERNVYMNPLTTQSLPRQAGGATTFAMANFVQPTMLKRATLATAEGTLPYLGYAGTGWNIALRQYYPGDRYVSYDAIYVAYGQDPSEPPHGYVMNRVVGTPYYIPEVRQAMDVRIRDILTMPIAPDPPTPPRNEVFGRIENYGKIAGASDHMAVYADV